MAKKKKGKKYSSSKAKPQSNMSYPDLLNEGRDLLDKDKPREALPLLKQAVKLRKDAKGDQDTTEVDLLLFQAYQMREKQLRLKGLDREADVVRQQAGEVCPPLEKLSDAQVLLYFSGAAGNQVVKAYNTWLKKNKASRMLEEVLAGRLITENFWDELRVLPDDAPLKKDAPAVQKAQPAMQAGQWEEAAEALRAVPRLSPYSPVRLFCRGMAAFYQQNDADAARALGMLPEHFPLYPFARKLHSFLSDPQTSQETLHRSLPELFEVAPTLETDLEQIVAILERPVAENKFRQLVERICSTVYPADVMAARMYLLEALVIGIGRHTEFEHIGSYISSCLPADNQKCLMAKCQWLCISEPLRNASLYIEYLAQEFRDAAEQNLAKSQVLVKTALVLDHKPPYYTESGGFYANLGVKPAMACNLVFGLLAQAIELDPYHREAYESLAERPRTSRPERNLVEQALERMRSHFVQDPYPCLKLADLYYEKNAYRKAETILNQALELAPHDQRVLNKHTAALLFSGSRNLAAGNLAVAARDITRAEGRGTKKAFPFIIVMKLLLEALDKQQNLENVLHGMALHFELFSRLRIYSLLMLMIERRPELLKTAPLRVEFENRFKEDLNHVKEITLPELILLLEPLDKDFARAFYTSQIAPVFLKPAADRILPLLADEDILNLYPQILTDQTVKVLQNELKRRLKRHKGPLKIALNFLQISIDHLFNSAAKPRLFENLLKKIDPQQLERLKDLSRRLAPLAQDQELRAAFTNFEFDDLYDWAPGRTRKRGRLPAGMPDLPPDFPPDLPLEAILRNLIEELDLDDDDFDEDDDFDPGVFDPDDFPIFEQVARYASNANVLDVGRGRALRDELLNDLDDFLEYFDLDSKSPTEIREIRSEMMAMPFLKGFMKDLKIIFTRRRFPGLPAYARVFIFG